MIKVYKQNFVIKKDSKKVACVFTPSVTKAIQNFGSTTYFKEKYTCQMVFTVFVKPQRLQHLAVCLIAPPWVDLVPLYLWRPLSLSPSCFIVQWKQFVSCNIECITMNIWQEFYFDLYNYYFTSRSCRAQKQTAKWFATIELSVHRVVSHWLISTAHWSVSTLLIKSHLSEHSLNLQGVRIQFSSPSLPLYLLIMYKNRIISSSACDFTMDNFDVSNINQRPMMRYIIC